MAQKRQKSGLCQWPTNAWPPLKQGNVPKTEAIITVVSPANFFFLVRSPENWDGIFFSALEAERPGFSMRQFSSVQFGSIFFFLLFFCSLAKWCWLSAELVWFADLPCATSASVSPASACRDEQKVEQKTWKPYNRVVVVSQIYKKKTQENNGKKKAANNLRENQKQKKVRCVFISGSRLASRVAFRSRKYLIEQIWSQLLPKRNS